MLKILKGCLQVLALFLFADALNALTTALNIKIPGSIIGLILLFILLQTKVVKLSWIETGGSFLLAELLLFFIPSAVGMMQYQHLLMDNGLKILVIIISSSLIVMIGSGLLAEQIGKLVKRKEEKQV
ncbi:CidA/LrgA family holin-like protein [Heyndrickxia acidicola]|uniref:CidA/LrgA family holin-like protein n=1 Tax=Heyndrickxia acidicola TaxID=209389 RepID=A0ABU6MG89_9BACI|nr:CidA/LrgA family holin-like protein [Heyndrickxia acidicola]MED1203294.1 CidA/LrgA family holin-like protein [Heyndrickxia acidicola]